MGSTKGFSSRIQLRGKVRTACRGFTLIEILIVIGIIAILAAVVIVAINPARQFAEARDSQRTSNVDAVLDAIGQNMADHKGIFACALSVPLNSAPSEISNDGANILPCLVPDYMPEMPYDPSAIGANVTDVNSYDTGYTVSQDTFGRVTVCAPTTESAIPRNDPICVTR